jgi:hypothetical protein
MELESARARNETNQILTNEKRSTPTGLKYSMMTVTAQTSDIKFIV